MSAPIPDPIPSQNRQAQQMMLAAFPFIALGVVGIALAALLLTLGRVNRAHLNLWVCVGCAFLGGIFELINVLRTNSENPPRLSQLLPGLVVADGIALGFFTTFHLFFLSRPCRQPPISDNTAANFPLPVSRAPLASADRTRQEPALVPPVLVRCVKPALWVAILSVGHLETTWRIGVRRNVNAYEPVYTAANSMQLVLQLVFLFKVTISAVHIRGRPRAGVLLPYLPFFLAILLGVVISGTALISFAFTETPLGRLLIFIEMYIFLLETSLLDFTRPYRDSFSFEHICSRPRLTSSGDGDGEGNKVGQAASPAPPHSPLDRAAVVTTEPAGPPRTRRESELTVGPSPTDPSLRRLTNLPSCWPNLRTPSHAGASDSSSERQEHLSLNAAAAQPGWGALDDAWTDPSILAHQADQLRVRRTLSRAPSPPLRTGVAVLTELSDYRFPDGIEATSGRAKEPQVHGDENVLPIASPMEMNEFPQPSSVQRAKRRNRPVLTVATALSALSTTTSSSQCTRAQCRTSKPFPLVPPLDLITSTSSTTILRSHLGRLLPSPPPHSTTSLLAAPSPGRPAFPPSVSDDTLAHLDHGNNPNPGQRASQPVSLTTTARSSTTVDGGVGVADRFPYPPPAALIRTSSGRTGTTTSLGRIWTRERSEFDLFLPADESTGVAGMVARARRTTGGGGPGVEWKTGDRRRSCNRLTPGEGVDVDVTSLIMGPGEADDLQEKLCSSVSGRSGTTGSEGEQGGREGPVAGVERPSTPTLPTPIPLYYRGAAGLHLPLAPSLPLRPARTSPSRLCPPHPATVATQPQSSPSPWHSANIPLSSSLSIPSPANASPPRNAFYPSTLVLNLPHPGRQAFFDSSSRRPSAGSLAAQRIRAERQSLCPHLSVDQASPDGEAMRMRRFVSPGASKWEGIDVGREGRIVLDPAAAFENPRKVLETRGERFRPKGRKVGCGGFGDGEGEVLEVVGVAVRRETGEKVLTSSGK